MRDDLNAALRVFVLFLTLCVLFLLGAVCMALIVRLGESMLRWYA